MALPAPDLNIPSSTNTVEVSIINTTATIHGVDLWKFISPAFKGHDYLAVPCFSFLIKHPTLNRQLVFDLGIRKDWWNYSPFLQDRFKKGGYVVSVEKNVREILDEHGVDTKSIEAVVWSHWHWDHTGDPSTFEPSTALIVGPGFKEKMLPGYPGNPDSSFLEADYAGRELRQLSFEEGSPGSARIGRFPAIDYFGDGSFYFLDAPGHAVGHLCAFARVTSSPDSFILMGADAFHHGGEVRPSAYMPLPAQVSPHPFISTKNPATMMPCPGAMFEELLPKDEAGKPVQKPFYEPARLAVGQMHADVDEAIATIGKVQEADVADNVFVVAAHDEDLLDVVDFFPKPANDFMRKGWNVASRWKFLKDFSAAVGWEGEIEGKRSWAPPPKPS